MRLYVMRHGPAEDRAPTGRDFDRMLTRAGREVVERAARALDQARGATPLRILASPFRRARETAEVVAAHLAAGAPELHDGLGADAEVPFSLIRELHAAGADALVVGHQPIVEELVRALVHPAHPSIPTGFRTATIAVVERGHDGRAVADPWRLIAVIDPHAADR